MTIQVRTHLILWVLLCLSSVHVHAQSLSEIRRQHEEVIRQIDATQKALESNKSTISNMLYQYNALNNKVKESERYLSALTAEYRKTTEELNKLNAENSQLEKQLNECKDDYAKMVRQIYLHLKDRDKLSFIFSAEDFNQSIRRMRYLNDYSHYEHDKAKEIKAKQSELEEVRSKLEIKKQEQEELVKEQQGARDKLKGERSKQDKMVKQMRRKNTQLTEELKKQRQKAAKLNDMIDKFIAEENRKSSSATPDGQKREAATQGGYAMTIDEKKLSDEFGKNKGLLPFPVNQPGVVVVHFGQDKHSDMKYVQNSSSGIDIKTSPGASARAVFKGYVSKVFTLQGGNYNILIRHGNYLTVYTNLSDVSVTTGQTVKTGQELGHIYVDKAQDNKTILHFQVRLDKDKLDPEGWLKRQ